MYAAFYRSLIGVASPFGILALLGTTIVSAAEADLEHIRVSASAPPPSGWSQFCGETPSECRPVGSSVPKIALTSKRWAELVAVNSVFNEKIRPLSDLDQYGTQERWTYAVSGAGDCEDYVLEKRRELLRRGWPSSVLLVTVVLDKEQLGHAVLTVETDRGEFVLDNQESQVKIWSDTGLTFVKRQSAKSPNDWINLGWLVGDLKQLTAGLRRSPK